MTCVLHHVWVHLCLASPLVLNSSGMSTTSSPCNFITTCSHTAKRHFPLSITWDRASQASWSPRGLLPLVSQLPGERNCSRVTTWWSEGKGPLEPNHPSPNLSPVCFLPVWLWPSYLAKLSLSFLLSCMRVIVGGRELCQRLVAICWYESWVNECSAGPQPGRQYMELVLLFREHLDSWSFCQLWTHFPRLCLRALHPSQRLIVFLQPHPHIWLHLLI